MNTGVIMRNSKARTFLYVLLACTMMFTVLLLSTTHTKLKDTQESHEKCQQQRDSLSAQLQVVYEHKSRLEKTLHSEAEDKKRSEETLKLQKEECEKDKQSSQTRISELEKKAEDLEKSHQEEFGNLKMGYNALQQEKEKLEAELASHLNHLNQQKEENIRLTRELMVLQDSKKMEAGAELKIQAQLETCHRESEQLRRDVEQLRVAQWQQQPAVAIPQQRQPEVKLQSGKVHDLGPGHGNEPGAAPPKADVKEDKGVQKYGEQSQLAKAEVQLRKGLDVGEGQLQAPAQNLSGDADHKSPLAKEPVPTSKSGAAVAEQAARPVIGAAHEVLHSPEELMPQGKQPGSTSSTVAPQNKAENAPIPQAVPPPLAADERRRVEFHEQSRQSPPEQAEQQSSHQSSQQPVPQPVQRLMQAPFQASRAGPIDQENKEAVVQAHAPLAPPEQIDGPVGEKKGMMAEAPQVLRPPKANLNDEVGNELQDKGQDPAAALGAAERPPNAGNRDSKVEAQGNFLWDAHRGAVDNGNWNKLRNQDENQEYAHPAAAAKEDDAAEDQEDDSPFGAAEELHGKRFQDAADFDDQVAEADLQQQPNPGREGGMMVNPK